MCEKQGWFTSGWGGSGSGLLGPLTAVLSSTSFLSSTGACCSEMRAASSSWNIHGQTPDQEGAVAEDQTSKAPPKRHSGAWPLTCLLETPIPNQNTQTHQSSLSRSPEVDGFESHGGRVDRGCSLNDGWCWFDGREGPLYCRRVWHHGDHFWDLQEHIHRQFTHNREAQTDQVRTSEQPPEVQQPCAGWAEGPAEALGPVRAEGAPWEAEEEAEVEEALLEVHASSAASDQLQNNTGIKSHHHCLPEFEV